MNIRIGQGFDAHRFQSGGRLVLGGVTIPHHAGLEAHSDGDVVIHAICDALLGAAALNDIGHHFPDSNPEFKNVDSRILLRKTTELLAERNYSINNVDVTIVAQKPKLSPYREKMQTTLAADMKIDTQQINIKATTTEGMGFAGREEGIGVFAVVTIKS